jgi:hypothetical protein
MLFLFFVERHYKLKQQATSNQFKMANSEKTEMQNDLKKLFGEHAWFMSDSDYISCGYKLDWFVKCGKGCICVIDCIDGKDLDAGEIYHLDYNCKHWGSEEFDAILGKYNLGVEWYDYCYAYLYYENKK